MGATAPPPCSSGAALGATAPCNIHQPSPTTLLIGGCSGSHSPVQHPPAAPAPRKRGEKAILWLGWGCAGSITAPQVLPAPGWVSQQRGTVGAPLALRSCRSPESPRSTLQHLPPVRTCAAVPGCTEPIFGDQSGGDAAWEGRHVPSRGGTPVTPGTAGSKSLLHGAVGKAAAGSAGAAGISLALARSVLISTERRQWQDCSLISLAITS